MNHKFELKLAVYLNPERIAVLKDGDKVLCMLVSPGAIVLDPEPDKGTVAIVDGQIVKYVRQDE